MCRAQASGEKWDFFCCCINQLSYNFKLFAKTLFSKLNKTGRFNLLNEEQRRLNSKNRLILKSMETVSKLAVKNSIFWASKRGCRYNFIHKRRWSKDTNWLFLFDGSFHWCWLLWFSVKCLNGCTNSHTDSFSIFITS